MRASALIAAAAITAAVLTGCGSLGSPATAAGTSSPGAPAPSPASCASRFTSWRDGGGAGDLGAVQGDLGALARSLTALGSDMGTGADLPSGEAAVQQAAGSLQSDAQAAQADAPPSCVPGLRKNVSAALTDYNRAAIDCNQAIAEMTGGSNAVAMPDIYAANRAMNAGNGKIGKATAAIKAFSGN